MIKLILPATNHKPNWVDIRVNDAHMGRVWGQVDNVHLDKAIGQFMVAVSNDGTTQAYLWADTIEKAPK